MSRWRVSEERWGRSGVNSSGVNVERARDVRWVITCCYIDSRGTRKVTRKAPRGTRSEVACKVRASPRKVTCILARRRAKNACIATYSSCGSMRDCVEVSRVSRAASDAAWNRSCCAERRWGVEFAFSSWCGAAGRRGAAQRRRRLGMDFARNIFMVHA